MARRLRRWTEHWSADPSALRDGVFKRWHAGSLRARFWHSKSKGSTYWPPTAAILGDVLAEHARSCAVKELWRAGEDRDEARVRAVIERGVCVHWDLEARRCLECVLAGADAVDGDGAPIFAKAEPDDLRQGQLAQRNTLTLLQWLLLPADFGDRASMVQTVRLVQVLLSLGASVHTHVLHGAIRLDGALEKNRIQGGVVPLVLGAGADIALRDAQQQTPLHAACAVASVDAVRALLKRGADVQAKDTTGRIALQLIPSTANELRELLSTYMRRTKEAALAARHKKQKQLTNVLLKGPSQWSCSDVSKWVRLEGFRELAQSFSAARVDGRKLASFITNELAAFRTLSTFDQSSTEWTDDAAEARCDQVAQLQNVLQKLPRLFAFFDAAGAGALCTREVHETQIRKQTAAAQKHTAKKEAALLKTRQEEVLELEELARATIEVNKAGDDTSELRSSIAWALSSCRESVVTHGLNRDVALSKAQLALRPRPAQAVRTNVRRPGTAVASSRPSSAMFTRSRRPKSAAIARASNPRAMARPKSAAVSRSLPLRKLSVTLSTNTTF